MMYERLDSCPVCSHTEIHNFLICKDFTVTQESFAISECRFCNTKFTNPRPDINNIAKYYESENYISHSNTANNIINFIYKIARKFTLSQKYYLIKSFTEQKGKILDYGCGTGNFLAYCKEKGWNTVGVEPNENARIEASKSGLKIYDSIENLHKEESFDVITLWHVLEHVHDLNSLIKNLKSKLNKNGIICVAIPNIDSYDNKYYKEYWAAYDLPRHLYHFDQFSFKKFVRMSKLKVVDIKPMKLDAFYVSMLSEKYKNGKNNFLRAIKIGLQSNKIAKENNNNYSSLIYLLKK